MTRSLKDYDDGVVVECVYGIGTTSDEEEPDYLGNLGWNIGSASGSLALHEQPS